MFCFFVPTQSRALPGSFSLGAKAEGGGGGGGGGGERRRERGQEEARREERAGRAGTGVNGKKRERRGGRGAGQGAGKNAGGSTVGGRAGGKEAREAEKRGSGGARREGGGGRGGRDGGTRKRNHSHTHSTGNAGTTRVTLSHEQAGRKLRALSAAVNVINEVLYTAKMNILTRSLDKWKRSKCCEVYALTIIRATKPCTE